jgi:hypothetical protein
MKLHPGDKVRVTNTAFDCSEDVIDIVVATQDSIATIMSFDDYCDYARGIQKGLNVDAEKYNADLRERMDEGKTYPIRIEEFVPYEDDDSRVFVECSAGYVTTLGIRFLEKVPD